MSIIQHCELSVCWPCGSHMLGIMLGTEITEIHRERLTLTPYTSAIHERHPGSSTRGYC